MECPGRKSQQLGFSDLASNNLLAQCAAQNGSTIYIYLVVLFHYVELPNISRRSHSRARQDK